MSEQYQTMPGAKPLRMSDDQVASYQQRTYVQTGAAVSSQADSLPAVAPPAHVALPPRASADTPPASAPASPATTAGLVPRGVGLAPRGVGLAPVGIAGDSPSPAAISSPSSAAATVSPPPTEHISPQLAADRVAGLCQLLDADPTSLSRSQQAILRADVIMLEELAKLANEHLAELDKARKSTSSRSRTKKKVTKRKTRKRS